MRLQDVATLLGARVIPAGAAEEFGAEIADLAYDSRAVRPGALFFCLPGKVDDGHRWAGDAVRAGALALVCERALAAAVPQLLVASARRAMNRLAAPFFGHPSRSLSLAGVTGTNGKTTVSFMLEAIFRAAGFPTGLVGTVETRVGGRSSAATRTTPESVDLQRLLRRMLDEGVRAAAMEVTSIGLDEGRVDGTVFAAAGFTNLTQDHLDYHGDLESYYRSKRALFTGTFLPGSRAFAAVNVGDPFGARLAHDLISQRAGERGAGGTGPAGPGNPPGAAPRCVTFTLASTPGGGDPTGAYGSGPSREPDVVGQVLETGPAGSRLRLAGPPGEVLEAGMDGVVQVALPGRFNAANALAAAVIARGLGVPSEAVAAGLAGLDRVPGRFELVDEGQPFSVVVDYAHTPDGLARVLAAAREVADPGRCPGGRSPRVIAVFGCGGDRDRGKRPLMGRAAAEAADLVYVTSDNPRSEEPQAIMAGIEEGIAGDPPPLGYRLVADRAEAIAAAIAAAGPGDVVVIAGKGHETTQSFAGRSVPFNDLDVARAALRAGPARERTR
jgi:UDP-N-acetylmuramoyl-L-alanyl-D-glutamate--2,6-diaminopimelate ligase